MKVNDGSERDCRVLEAWLDKPFDDPGSASRASPRK
jgi:hypothetical protein